MIIVTGMHRSGTSFCSQVLNYLGCDFGPEELLFPADMWNQSGYFESISVIDINNRLILGNKASIHYWMDAPTDFFGRLKNSIVSRKWKYFLFPKIDAINSVLNVKQYLTEIEKVGTIYQNKFVKDPRFCLTLGVWERHISTQGIVFSFRNPVSVAGSVRRRERLPRRFGEMYWYYHIKSFFSQVGDETPIYLCNFDNFFDSETQVDEFRRIANFVGDIDEAVLGALPSVLDIRLRTQTAFGESRDKLISDAYNCLLSLHAHCQNGEVIKMKDFPEIRKRILGAP